MSHDHVNRPLIRVAVRVGGEGRPQTGEGHARRGAPIPRQRVAVARPLVGACDLAVCESATAIVDEQQAGGIRLGLDSVREIELDSLERLGHQHGDAINAGLSAWEADDAGVEIDRRNRERDEVAGEECAVKAEKTGGIEKREIADRHHGREELVCGVELRALAKPRPHGRLGRLDEVRAEVHASLVEVLRVPAWSCPVEERRQIDDVTPAAARGFVRDRAGESAEPRRTGDGRGLLLTDGEAEAGEHVAIVVVRAPGEFPRLPGFVAMPEVSLEHFGELPEVGTADGETGLLLCDHAAELRELGREQDQRVGQRHRLGDVTLLQIHGLVPAVFGWEEAIRGAEILVFLTELAEPRGIIHKSIMEERYGGTQRKSSTGRHNHACFIGVFVTCRSGIVWLSAGFVNRRSSVRARLAAFLFSSRGILRKSISHNSLERIAPPGERVGDCIPLCPNSSRPFRGLWWKVCRTAGAFLASISGPKNKSEKRPDNSADLPFPKTNEADRERREARKAARLTARRNAARATTAKPRAAIARTPMKRGGPINPISDKRLAEKPARAACIAAVELRAGGKCELAIPGVCQAGGEGRLSVMDVHEKRLRAQDSTAYLDPSRCLHACRACHDHAHLNRPEARAAGHIQHREDLMPALGDDYIPWSDRKPGDYAPAGATPRTGGAA